MALTKVSAEMGAGWRLIGTQEASTSASLTQTGLDSTYDTYVVVLSDLIPATDNQALWIRLGDSSGIDSGASDYRYHAQTADSSAAAYAGINSSGAAQLVTGTGVGNASGEAFSGTYFIGSPSDGSVYASVYGHASYLSAGTNTYIGTMSGHRNAVITLDRVQILFASGNITSGRMSVYGVTHA